MSHYYGVSTTQLAPARTGSALTGVPADVRYFRNLQSAPGTPVVVFTAKWKSISYDIALDPQFQASDSATTRGTSALVVGCRYCRAPVSPRHAPLRQRGDAAFRDTDEFIQKFVLDPLNQVIFVQIMLIKGAAVDARGLDDVRGPELVKTFFPQERPERLPDGLIRFLKSCAVRIHVPYRNLIVIAQREGKSAVFHEKDGKEALSARCSRTQYNEIV